MKTTFFGNAKHVDKIKWNAAAGLQSEHGQTTASAAATLRDQ
jgi:hypothetical protein